MVIHSLRFFFNPLILADIFYRSVMVTVLIRLQIKESLRPEKFNSRFGDQEKYLID